jgi:hypothetical protein
MKEPNADDADDAESRRFDVDARSQVGARAIFSVPRHSAPFRAIPRHPSHPSHPRSILLLPFRDRDGSTPDRWLPNNWADCDSAQLMVQ